MSKKRVIISIAAAAVLCISFVFFMLRVRPVLEQTAFVGQEWVQGDIRVRGKMVRDLIGRKILDGKTRSEVIALLGTPEETSAVSVSYIVDLGHMFGSAPWTYRLYIRFDDSNRVRNYFLHD